MWNEVQVGLIGVNKLRNMRLTASVYSLLTNHLNINPLLSFHGEFFHGQSDQGGEKFEHGLQMVP